MQMDSPALLADRAPGHAGARPALIRALCDPRRYPGGVTRVELHETHISWVLVAGDFAYKIKKPVRLAFLDFSTLAARRHFCEEELRLNRAIAPKLYLDVVPIAGTESDPRIGGEGEPIDYAVRMRRFAQADLLSSRASRHELTPAEVGALARRVAEMHTAARRIPYDRRRNHAARVVDPALDNIAQLTRMRPAAEAIEVLRELRQWTLDQGEALAGTFVDRVAGGFQRECHGDLHLANVVLLDGEVTPFDCIEFSPELRCTDVAADVAFAAMDLRRHGMPRAAARFVNRYLEITGDYGLPRVLRFYEVYRALVRAKVALLRAQQEAAGGVAWREALRDHAAHLELATAVSRRPAPVLVIMHGPSGSGKTFASERLLEAMGGIRLRSDVERKRLHGLDPAKPAVAAFGAGIYAASQSRDTYDRLAELARAVVAAGYPAIVDAAFLGHGDRKRFADLARSMDAGFQIASCKAPAALLRERVRERARRGKDASDAGPAVLEEQLARAEPLLDDERVHATILDTSKEPDWKGAVESLARRFGSGYARSR